MRQRQYIDNRLDSIIWYYRYFTNYTKTGILISIASENWIYIYISTYINIVKYLLNTNVARF